KEILDELKKVNGLHLQYQEEITEKIITENKANMKGIADTVPDAPSEAEADKIKNLSKMQVKFGAAHKGIIAEMLEYMNMSGILSENKGLSEDKDLAFAGIISAHKALDTAVESKDRKAIQEAVKNYRDAYDNFNQLLIMAKEGFKENAFTTGLDLMDRKNVPWDFLRNTSGISQVNSVYLLGCMFKDYCAKAEKNFTELLDEFKADPGAVIKRVNDELMKDEKDLQGIVKDKSQGEIINCLNGDQLKENLEKAEEKRKRYEKAMEGIIRCEKNANENTPDNLILLNEGIKKYDKKLIEKRIANAKPLAQRTQNSFAAIKTLVLLDKNELKADEMLSEEALDVYGFKKDNFRLAAYLGKKNKFNYAAQENRLEELLKEIAKERDPKKRMRVDLVLKARMEALTELLTIKGYEKNKPGFAALEDEIAHMTEKYEAFRNANRNLNLPELSRDDKKILQKNAAVYNDFKRNRAKKLAGRESLIKAAIKAEEKAFIAKVKAEENALDKAMRKKDEYLQKVEHNNSPGRKDEYLRLAKLEDTKIKDKKHKISDLKLAWAKKLVKAYSAGKISKYYVDNRLMQLKNERIGGVDMLPPLFENTNAAYFRNGQNELKRKFIETDREKFLSADLMESLGISCRNKCDISDNMNVIIEELSEINDNNLREKNAVVQAGNVNVNQAAGQNRNAGMEGHNNDAPRR
ncbi:MAG: hypothetical protein K5894_05670, partial [Lachnospiraceae bacterium]|nr:hypothetical protein [Lachnospiraceae bacterium]